MTWHAGAAKGGLGLAVKPLVGVTDAALSVIEGMSKAAAVCAINIEVDCCVLRHTNM